jgi:hypothetical protein
MKKNVAAQASRNIENYQQVQIAGKAFRLPPKARPRASRLVGYESIVDKVLAAWTPIDGHPMSPRIFGPPGVGKTEFANHLAQLTGQDLYVMNGQEDMTAEDISVTATITATSAVEYVASPLFVALLTGGICFFDEIGKTPPGALASLSSVLDVRRELTSVLAGVCLPAHPEFRFICALNEAEEQAVGLPDYIQERTLPAIRIEYPPFAALEPMLRSHLHGPAGEPYIEAFLAEFHATEISPRRATMLIKYAMQLAITQQQVGSPDVESIRGMLRQLGEETGFVPPESDDRAEERSDTDASQRNQHDVIDLFDIPALN